MASYELSGPADRDLTEIYVCSYRQFGELKADDYLLALHERFAQVAEHPAIGRSIDYLRAGYFRLEHASHTIFYVRTANGIGTMRVLHERMDPDRHLWHLSANARFAEYSSESTRSHQRQIRD